MDDPQVIFYATLALAFGAGICLVYGLVSTLVGPGSKVRARLHRSPSDEGTETYGGPLQVLRDHRMSRFEAFNVLLKSHPLADSIALELAQARVTLNVGEYLMLRVVCAAGAAVLLWTIGGTVLAVIPGALIGYFGPKIYVGNRRRKRLSTINMQLIEALALSANSLRAGWGFLQAMSQVANDMPAPISEEFGEVIQEVSIGTSNEVAIQNLMKRVPSYDLELVMTAVLIQRQIGGNLAEMMDSIAFTIRERIRLLADITSITAESKLSMWLLGALPVGLMMFLATFEPDYMLPFMNDDRGRLMLIAAGTLEVIGMLIIRRLADIRA